MFPYISEFIQQRPNLPQINEPNTVNTTRINYEDMYNFDIAMTKLIYPSKNIDWRPHAIILVPSDMWQYGTCASSLVHFPINAPIMFTENFYLPPMILNEIQRLAPTGESVPAKVLIVGPISQGVENQIRMSGLTTYRVTNTQDVYKACVDISRFRLNVVPSTSEESKKDVMVISGQDYTEGIPTAFYAAHMGVPIILVGQNNIPQSIQTFISNNRNKNYYIVGSTRTVSGNVESQIRNLISGKVERISGNDPYSISVNFAKYQSPVDMFGWKHNKKDGWAFTFGELRKWYLIVSGVLLAHLGKHTPLLITDKNNLPSVVRDYVISVNPQKPMPHLPPYMHAYILGGFNDITHSTQVEIEKVTDIEGKMER